QPGPVAGRQGHGRPPDRRGRRPGGRLLHQHGRLPAHRQGGRLRQEGVGLHRRPALRRPRGLPCGRARGPGRHAALRGRHRQERPGCLGSGQALLRPAGLVQPARQGRRRPADHGDGRGTGGRLPVDRPGGHVRRPVPARHGRREGPGARRRVAEGGRVVARTGPRTGAAGQPAAAVNRPCRSPEGVLVDFRIMGPLEVRGPDGEDRTPTVPKHRELLALFLLNPGRPLTAGRLRNLLWPREGGDRSDSLIRGYVGQLRRLIGQAAITTVSGAYQLNLGDGYLDVDRFRLLVGRGAYAEALALWRGEALEDVDPEGERWAQTRRLREELEELRLLALERRVQADLDAG